MCVCARVRERSKGKSGRSERKRVKSNKCRPCGFTHADCVTRGIHQFLRCAEKAAMSCKIAMDSEETSLSDLAVWFEQYCERGMHIICVCVCVCVWVCVCVCVCVHERDSE